MPCLKTYSAQIVFSSCDDDRPSDNRVGSDEPDHPVLQVHLAHACVVRVDVPCMVIGGDKQERKETKETTLGPERKHSRELTLRGANEATHETTSVALAGVSMLTLHNLQHQRQSAVLGK